MSARTEKVVDFKSKTGYVGLKELQDVHRRMVRMEVTGTFSKQQIADECGFHVQCVRRFFREDPLVIEYRNKLRDEVEQEAKSVRLAAETKLMESTLKFVDALVDIAENSEQDNARASAARYGLQFAGLQLVDPAKSEVKTPHLAIRDTKKEADKLIAQEKKTG